MFPTESVKELLGFVSGFSMSQQVRTLEKEDKERALLKTLNGGNMHLADYQEDQRTRNFWTYFPDIPVGSIFSFCGPTEYKKTGDATYREHCSYDRSERIYAEKDLGKLLKVVKVVER